jgi:hypothetical protein
MRVRFSIASSVVLMSALVGGVSASNPAGASAHFLPGVTGLCGTAVVSSMPLDLRQDSAEDSAVRVIPEARLDAQQLFPFSLSFPVQTDAAAIGTYDRPGSLPLALPTVPAGEPVASFLVHWDPPGDPGVAIRRTVTIGFSHAILGVQIRDSIVGSAASQQFHASGVSYPTGAQGLVLDADGKGDALRIVDRYTVSFSFTGSVAVKEFRVITVGLGSSQRFPGFLAAGPHGSGYSMLAADGGVFVFEPDGGFWGSLGATRLNQPVVAGARTCSGEGYWLAARDGGVFSFGDAPFHGSLGNAPPTAPVVAMTATTTGAGYDLVTSTGHVSTFGDAHFYGDTRALHLNQPIVGISATPTGNGYWLVASDGGIFAFGDATFYGSTGGIHLNRPIVGMRAARNGNGYYLLASDGGVFTFSTTQPWSSPVLFYGSAGASPDPHSFVAMRLTFDGRGYWLTDSAGKVFGFGPSAPAGQDLSGTRLASPVIGML